MTMAEASATGGSVSGSSGSGNGSVTGIAPFRGGAAARTVSGTVWVWLRGLGALWAVVYVAFS